MVIKTRPSFDFQNNLFDNILDKKSVIIGIDEVGRGPLAGDVFACAVFIEETNFSNELENKIDDSKKIPELKREKIFEELIKNKSVHYGIGRKSVEIIDSINILQATFLSMQDAYFNLKNKLNFSDENSYILIDGNMVPPFFKDFSNVRSVVRGDSLSLSIAASSIIAKVLRDNYMKDMSILFPCYGFDKNKGYGTKEHIDAIKKFGPCSIHRKSFLKNILK